MNTNNAKRSDEASIPQSDFSENNFDLPSMQTMYHSFSDSTFQGALPQHQNRQAMLPPPLDPSIMAPTYTHVSAYVGDPFVDFAAIAQPVHTSLYRKSLSQRQLFLVFIKLIFKSLERSGDHRMLLRAKALVAECTRRNRMGDSEYTPLQDAVERRLRAVLGEDTWTRSKLTFDQYCRRKGFSQTGFAV